MESESLNPISPQTGDAESKMRRNLGLDGGTANGSPPSQSHDPLKAARQTIRSQVTAREFTERQLAQAQTAIQDLRSKLRHVHQEREAAVSAAQSAMVAKDNAERTMRAAETALATERATRVRTEGMLRDAEATIRDLREKLATANQTLHGVRAELAAERLTRPKPDDTSRPAIPTPESVASPIRDAAAPTVRRPVGRPRKTAVVEPVLTSAKRPEQPQALPMEVPANRDESAVPIIRRPVGRPRKTAVVQPVEKPIRVQTKPQASAKTVSEKADKPEPKAQGRAAANGEPIQWWVDGWKGR